jgi:hypothetical protein
MTVDEIKSKIASTDYNNSNTRLTDMVNQVILEWRTEMLKGMISVEDFHSLKETLWYNLHHHQWNITQPHLNEIATITFRSLRRI